MSFVGFAKSCLGARKGRAMHPTARMQRLWGKHGPGCWWGAATPPHGEIITPPTPDMLRLLRNYRNRLVLQQTPSA